MTSPVHDVFTPCAGVTTECIPTCIWRPEGTWECNRRDFPDSPGGHRNTGTYLGMPRGRSKAGDPPHLKHRCTSSAVMDNLASSHRPERDSNYYWDSVTFLVSAMFVTFVLYISTHEYLVEQGRGRAVQSATTILQEKLKCLERSFCSAAGQKSR